MLNLKTEIIECYSGPQYHISLKLWWWKKKQLSVSNRAIWDYIKREEQRRQGDEIKNTQCK